MAALAPEVALQEVHEALDVVDRKAQALAEKIAKSKHFIVFTGAGVSTSAGIPDFRGPQGAWTLMAQGRQPDYEPSRTLQAIPTRTHMALVELQNRGLMKYLVSQNCDGLHRRSGIVPDKISELHGNSNLEYCQDCGKQYLRDFRAVATYEKSIHDHRTGRKCTACSGPLLDTIINFDEFLPEEPLRLARHHAKKADLCLVLGSSLTIPPACTIPEMVGIRPGAKLAICNLQETPLDGLVKDGELHVRARSDDLMERVMGKLGLEIPEFVLVRRLDVEVVRGAEGSDRHRVVVRGVDVDGTPASFLKGVRVEGTRRFSRDEPFVLSFRGELRPGTEVKLELEFMGHYGEPNVGVVYVYNGEGEDGVERGFYVLEYRPTNGEWTVEKSDE